MPVRKIPKNYRNVTGIAAYGKTCGQAMFESTLERDFITLLEFSHEVDSFEVQPVKLEWFDDKDKAHTYTPDVLVFYKEKGKAPLLCEVKYRSELHEHWPLFKPKFRAAVRFAKENGWRFKLITENEIRGVYLENAKFLLTFIRRGPQSETDMDLLAGYMAKVSQSTPTKMLAEIYEDQWNRARLIPTLWYLIGTGQIGTDLQQKLTMNSLIWSMP